MTSPPIRLRSLKKTCDACPSQWEGRTTDWKEVYIRYRWGRLTVQVAVDPTTNPLDADFLVNEVLGGSFDGFMTEDDLFEHLDGRVIRP